MRPAKLHIILAALMLLMMHDTTAQYNNRARQWMFGFGNGLDFSTVPPTPVSSQCNNYEATASISDANGNLLFYCDNEFIWNRNHVQMPNGFGLYNTASSTMGTLITPFIGNPDKYYVFQVDGSSCPATGQCGPMGKWDGLMYHVVDMSLDNNNGDVVAGMKNIILADSMSEKLTAVMHENGKDYWIITRKAFVSEYYCYLVTDSGICPDPVTSTTGNINGATIGALVPSHDGKVLANAENGGIPQLGDFDAATGKVSNMRDISTSVRNYYYAAFSPNDSIIYLSHSSSQPATVFQYKRHDPYIPATELSIGGMGPWGLYPNVLGIMGMRNWGDTIYCASGDSSYHIMTDPNNYGNPGIQTHAQMFTSTNFTSSPKMGAGLGNFFNYKYNSAIDMAFTLLSDTAICKDDSFSIGMPALSDHQYEWLPTTGLDDPYSSNPTAKPDSSTEYIVKVSFLCKTYYDTILVTVIEPILELPSDTGICPGDSLTLTAISNTPVYWSGIDTAQSITIGPAESGYYIATTSDSFCTLTRSIYISVYDTPSITLTSDTAISQGQSVELTASGATQYAWTPEDVLDCTDCESTWASPVTSTQFYIFFTDSNGCTGTDSVFVSISEQRKIFMPTAFSPNNDGVNDILYVRAVYDRDMTLNIFNRWGKIVYRSEDPSQGWDGTYNGNTEKPGVYIYRLGVSSAEEKNEYSGNITLVR